MYLLKDLIKEVSAFEKKWFASDIISNYTLITF